MSLNLKQVEIVGGPKVLATADQVAQAEAQLWISFPRDTANTSRRSARVCSAAYSCACTRLGTFSANWMNGARASANIGSGTKGKKLLPKEWALESVILGDTVNGDELVFHPCKPKQWFVLPRAAEKI
jgi:hypothetical protein